MDSTDGSLRTKKSCSFELVGIDAKSIVSVSICLGNAVDRRHLIPPWSPDTAISQKWHTTAKSLHGMKFMEYDSCSYEASPIVQYLSPNTPN